MCRWVPPSSSAVAGGYTEEVNAQFRVFLDAAGAGTLTIPAGRTTWSVGVTVRGDRKKEGDELFLVNLSNATGATISDGQGAGTIRNDD